MFYPDIPSVPGVPPLPRLPGVAGIVQDVVLIVADALGLLGGSVREDWGLFLDGSPAIVCDSVSSFDFRNNKNVPTYPLEEGAFESYNKVSTPFDVRLRYMIGGDVNDRQAMIASIEAALESLTLYDAVTPERIYESVNPVHIDYNRRAVSGVGLLQIDVWCQQIRVSAQATFSNSNTTASSSPNPNPTSTTEISIRSIGGSQISNPKSTSAAPQINDGTVQSYPAPSSYSDPLTGFVAGYQ